MELELIKWDRIKTEIAECQDINKLTKLSYSLDAIQKWSKQSGQSMDVQNDIAEYRIQLDRKRGAWVEGNIPKKPGNPNLQLAKNGQLPATLKKAGIGHHESPKLRALASVSDKVVEKYITETKKANKEITMAGVFKAVQKQKREDDISATTERIERGIDLPEGLFEVVVIDPPWPYGTKYDPATRRVANPYPEMSIEDIGKIIIPGTDDSSLWLWTTHKFLRDSFNLMEDWGYDYKATLVWNKEKLGIGHWVRMQAEFCLLGIKGKPVWNMKNERDIITQARGNHSAKPDSFYKMVEKVTVGRRLDWFSREEKEGWTSYGSE